MYETERRKKRWKEENKKKVSFCLRKCRYPESRTPAKEREPEEGARLRLTGVGDGTRARRRDIDQMPDAVIDAFVVEADSTCRRSRSRDRRDERTRRLALQAGESRPSGELVEAR